MIKNSIISILVFFTNLWCFSQDISDASFYELQKPERSGEKITLETDRNFYCINESIYFSASYQFRNAIQGINWSHVLYVELIRWNGDKIAQAKYKLNEYGASGEILIPNNLQSGNYYLRAYTKWMRNFPVDEYAYKNIKVVNPFDNKIDDGKAEDFWKHDTTIQLTRLNHVNTIECFTNKKTYNPREKVDITLLLNNYNQNDLSFCISAVKAGSIDTNICNTQHYDNKKNIHNKLIYLPEFRGLSISGKVINSDSKTPIANATLSLTIPQNWKYNSTFKTNSQGQFYFTLHDFYGEQDFYIDALIESAEKAEILIDNDFCDRSIQLKYIPFTLSDKERDVAQEMIVNMQLANIYTNNNKKSISDSSFLAFYGRPDYIYYTKDYIQLPNLDEFFFEIVKEVKAYKRKKETFLKLYSKNVFDKYGPLVLIDNIPVMDVDELLKVPLNKIEKVEVVNKPYIIAFEKYNGIISIFTKNKDFAGIKLNENSQFFSYNLFSPESIKKVKHEPQNDARVADRRNVLFWDPNMELQPKEPTKLSFYTSDGKGEYIIYIRNNSDNDFSKLYGTCKIRVE